VLEANVERGATREAVELDQQFQIPTPSGGERPEGAVVGMKPGGEREDTHGRGVSEELAAPGDTCGPCEGDCGVNQPARAGEIGIELHAPRPEARELHDPGFRVPRQVEGDLGGGRALRVPAGLEADLSTDPLPEVTPARAGGPEGIPSPAEHRDPVLDRLGEDGEDEQRDGGHGTPGRCTGER